MKKLYVNEKQIGKFAEYLVNEEKSEATVAKYLHDVQYFASYVGNSEIEKQTMINYKSHLGEVFAISSANSMLAALNLFMHFCDRDDMKIKRFRVQRAVFCSEDKELTREEYDRLIIAASKQNDNKISLVIQTICGTGIRVSELRYITLESLITGEAQVNCKGKCRRIFIVSQLRKKFKKYAHDAGIKSGPIFVNKKGEPLSRHYIWKSMKSLCRDAHVASSKVFPHNLRHLFARTFYKIEKDISKLADILGHSSIETTRIYIVTTGTEHRRKMENMRLII